MAKQTPSLVKTFAADAALANSNVCVVASVANSGNVVLPSAALATKFIGVVAEPTQAGSTTNAVAVQVAGIAQIQSDGTAPIAAGDYVVIANATGQVKSVTPASGTNVREIVGIALSATGNTIGLLADVLLQPMLYIGA